MPEAAKKGFEWALIIGAALLAGYLGIPIYMDSELDRFEEKLSAVMELHVKEMNTLIMQNRLNGTDVSRRLQNVETTQKTSVPYIDKFMETDLEVQKHLEFSKGKVAELEAMIRHTNDKLVTRVDTCAQRKRNLIDNLREKYDDAFRNLNEKVDNRHTNIVSILNKRTQDRFTGQDGERLKEDLLLTKDRIYRIEQFIYKVSDEDD